MVVDLIIRLQRLLLRSALQRCVHTSLGKGTGAGRPSTAGAAFGGTAGGPLCVGFEGARDQAPRFRAQQDRLVLHVW